MSVKTKNFIVSLLISLVYFLGILRFSTLVNKYLKSEFVLKNLSNINMVLLLIFGVLVYLFCKKFPTNSISKGSKKEPLVKSILIGVCYGIALLVVIQILFKILGFLGYPYDMTGEFIRIKNLVSNNKISLINMVFIIPFVTEIVYRSIVFGHLYDLYEGGYKFVRLFTPACLSGILFALINVKHALPVVVEAVIISLTFGYVYLKTKRIESAIIGHIVFSTGIVILSFIVKTSVL
ncbi:CPBP family intramembrane glutamic endopeptidase [Parvimonas sp. D2]|uniref:CPBP family intramembrane glutamic endopeptidase n=1 Tax=unclassified Parvimonas TaxID=1151464 RepID=UPI002B46AE70|nr:MULTISPECIES: CPBP family intramembrane glutamic endopeptidase [unclassified Parvimonas]MEB3012079.1 CPBP family intramembrane glutamic endopeptidase [Parvimonas sp. D2]MEB3087488.1 CPBP family intramembrane glutamic endopeptidase [Parvimonas sp. D4]